jgi:hypothetical protein
MNAAKDNDCRPRLLSRSNLKTSAAYLLCRLKPYIITKSANLIVINQRPRPLMIGRGLLQL